MSWVDADNPPNRGFPQMTLVASPEAEPLHAPPRPSRVMTGRPIVALAGAALVAAGLGACANRTNAPANVSPVTTPHAAARSGFPYALYTHCGIDEANIDGRWYAAETPRSDGNGNPPAGWGNPFQPGTMTIRSATEAEFTDSAGHRVTFILRPGATGPRQICS